eukprot:scpid30402/ scgid22862/ 
MSIIKLLLSFFSSSQNATHSVNFPTRTRPQMMHSWTRRLGQKERQIHYGLPACKQNGRREYQRIRGRVEPSEINLLFETTVYSVSSPVQSYRGCVERRQGLLVDDLLLCLIQLIFQLRLLCRRLLHQVVVMASQPNVILLDAL